MNSKFEENSKFLKPHYQWNPNYKRNTDYEWTPNFKRKPNFQWNPNYKWTLNFKRTQNFQRNPNYKQTWNIKTLPNFQTKQITNESEILKPHQICNDTQINKEITKFLTKPKLQMNPKF